MIQTNSLHRQTEKFIAAVPGSTLKLRCFAKLCYLSRYSNVPADKQMQNLWKFVKHIFNRVVETKVTEAAAAIAYYAILSFFPLILFLIAFSSSFLQSAEVQGQILKVAEE